MDFFFLTCTHTQHCAGIPNFVSFHEHRKHIVVHMAAVMRNWARVGFTEGISGHISVRDPELDGLMWMNPIGRHFALLNGSDMLCLRLSNGEIVGGNRVRLFGPRFARFYADGDAKKDES